MEVGSKHPRAQLRDWRTTRLPKISNAETEEIKLEGTGSQQCGVRSWYTHCCREWLTGSYRLTGTNGLVVPADSVNQ